MSQGRSKLFSALHSAAATGCVFWRALGHSFSCRASDLGDGHQPLLRVNNGFAFAVKEGIGSDRRGEWKRILGTNNGGKERGPGQRPRRSDRQSRALGPLSARHVQSRSVLSQFPISPSARRRARAAPGAAKCVGICSGSTDCPGLIILHVGTPRAALHRRQPISLYAYYPPSSSGPHAPS